MRSALSFEFLRDPAIALRVDHGNLGKRKLTSNELRPGCIDIADALQKAGNRGLRQNKGGSARQRRRRSQGNYLRDCGHNWQAYWLLTRYSWLRNENSADVEDRGRLTYENAAELHQCCR